MQQGDEEGRQPGEPQHAKLPLRIDQADLHHQQQDQRAQRQVGKAEQTDDREGELGARSLVREHLQECPGRSARDQSRNGVVGARLRIASDDRACEGAPDDAGEQ